MREIIKIVGKVIGLNIVYWDILMMFWMFWMWFRVSLFYWWEERFDSKINKIIGKVWKI